MKSLIMFTSKPLDYTECKKALEPIFPGIIVNEEQCYFGNPPKSFNFDFDSERNDESLCPIEKDIIDQVPIDNPYCTLVDYHKDSKAQKLIAALVSIYPDLYVLEDQISWVGPANEDIKLDYNYLNN